MINRPNQIDPKWKGERKSRMKEFNLIYTPWIPAVTCDGRVLQVSLREALINAKAYSRINSSLPHSTAALIRLLLAVLHRNFGPVDSEAWEDLWLRGSFDPDVLDSYFDRWATRFDLFASDHPFYQNRHPLVEEKPVQTLLQHIGGGDTFTLFDHVMDGDTCHLTPEEAAVLLVTAQAFSLAGLCHPQLKLVYTDAPCSRSIVFFVEGKNLFETLMFNLVRYNRENPIPWRRDNDDRPAWEMDDPYQPDRTTPLGYLDYLTWQNRRIMLIPGELNGRTVVERITTAPGLIVNAEQRNPMYHYERHPAKKKGEDYRRTMRFSEGRALWRDSYALLNRFSEAIEPPTAISWMAELVSDGILPKSHVQVAAYGMCTEPGKAKVHFYRGEAFEIDDLLLVNEDRVAILGTALNHAESLRRELWSTMTRLAALMIAINSDQEGGRKPDPKDVQNLVNHWDAEGLYWSKLELPFYRFLSGLSNKEYDASALDSWHQDLRAAVLRAYEQTVNGLGESQRAFKAAAHTQGWLDYGIKKVLGNIPKEG